MRLFIVRHAKAADRDIHTLSSDALRPLTAGGEAKFQRLAKRLKKLFDPPQVVLASGYVRAWETARILQESAAWPAATRCGALECDALGAAESLADTLHECNEDSIGLVGHEPFLSEFIARAIGADPGSIVMDKGAVAVIELDRSLRGGSLCALVSPGWIARASSNR